MKIREQLARGLTARQKEILDLCIADAERTRTKQRLKVIRGKKASAASLAPRPPVEAEQSQSLEATR